MSESQHSGVMEWTKVIVSAVILLACSPVSTQDLGRICNRSFLRGVNPPSNIVLAGCQNISATLFTRNSMAVMCPTMCKNSTGKLYLYVLLDAERCGYVTDVHVYFGNMTYVKPATPVSDNFREYCRSYPKILAKFYAQFCCRDLASLSLTLYSSGTPTSCPWANMKIYSLKDAP